jgi:AAA15 family ATPase/GTPase
MTKLRSVTLENFTAFSFLELELSPGVNVVIGKNGTGKTHLLKALYAACAITEGEDREKSFGVKLRDVFKPYEGRIGRLAKRKSSSVQSQISISGESKGTLSASFSNHTNSPDSIKISGETRWKKERLTSAYIPVKEMLSHAPGFLATAALREIAFEDVYIDIIKKAYLPKLKGPIDGGRKRLLDILQTAIEGKVVTKGEHFFLKNRQGDLEFTLLAEGMRKLALTWLLIQNGTLLNGSVLFWDEPEANLNPSLMGEVVEVILELQRVGVQVFVSTHNYVLLKEFDLRQKAADKLTFISLFRAAADDIQAETSPKISGISRNVILDTYSQLYDREIEQSIKGLPR